MNGDRKSSARRATVRGCGGLAARASACAMGLALVLSMAPAFCPAMGLTRAAFAAPETASAKAVAPMPLAPHRAVYDLSLIDGGKALAGAHGRIVYDLTGDACSGYSLDFRQLVELDRQEGPSDRIDIRTTTHEDADGASYRYRQMTNRAGGQVEQVQGVAHRTAPAAPPAGGAQDATAGQQGAPGIDITLTQPERRKLSAAGDIAFPSAHLRRILAAARDGQPTVDVKLYDGAETGAKVFDTFVVIGKRAAATADRKISEPLRKAGLDKVDRWPVTVSYYEPGPGERTPVYAISFDLYDNGVSGDMRINYGDFSLKAALSSLTQTGSGACKDAGKTGAGKSDK